MDFDQVLEEIGEFGPYQKTNYLLICLPVMFAAANSLSYVFTAGTPAYRRCLVPECDSVQGDSQNYELYPNWLVNATPGSQDSNGFFTPDSCYRYQANRTFTMNTSTTCPKELFPGNIKERCFQWVFNQNERTIVQEWNLTCKENAWKLAFVGTMHFAGLVVGTALSGYMADRYVSKQVFVYFHFRFGRKLIFVICIIFMAATGVAQGLAWNYKSFLIFAFLNAVGTSGVYPLAFIIGVEMVGPRKREMSSIVLNYFYAVGEAMVGLCAWFFHDWQLLQYVLSIPPLFFIAYYWMVPESVRWLIARNEKEQAKEIIRKAAQVNGKELSVALLANFESTDAENQKKNNCQDHPKEKCGKDCEHKKTDKHEIWLAVKEVFRSKILTLRYVLLLYIWAINAVVYYGLSLNSTSLSGNKYLNFALVCLIEIPGYTLAWISLNKFGRRLSLSGSMLLCAITCVVGGYITQGTTWATVCLFLVGKLGITSSFAVIYAYTAEMMPTIIRSGGVGVMSTFARFGAMLAPFVPILGNYYEALPLLLFGASSLSAGLLALLLPETFRKKLPDTVLEAKQLGKRKPQGQLNTKADIH
uniref:Major facilitator superfamily (MFS) profile domain-containing protein n=1 Tax=Glossina morsitans morsitans TaxID=37546 RepID=A0A1B0GFG9_GLOMM